MYYVCDDMGIVKEFDLYEEAEAYLENHPDRDDMWISSDDDEYCDYVDECGYDPYMGDYSWDC